MAAKNKTAETKVSVNDFINSFVDREQKKQDTIRLMKLMQKWSGFEPKMWGPTMIGFGKYHYKYDSGHEGESAIIGFSPRKAAFSLYENSPGHDNSELLDKLGKYTMGKYCIYFKKLDDLDLDTLEKFSKAAIKYVKGKYGVSK